MIPVIATISRIMVSRRLGRVWIRVPMHGWLVTGIFRMVGVGMVVVVAQVRMIGVGMVILVAEMVGMWMTTIVMTVGLIRMLVVLVLGFTGRVVVPVMTGTPRCHRVVWWWWRSGSQRRWWWQVDWQRGRRLHLGVLRDPLLDRCTPRIHVHFLLLCPTSIV